MHRLLTFLLTALAMVAAATASERAVVTTEQVRAELLAHAPEGVVAGKPLWLGLQLDHQPHWHTYWKNPGDSGLPTTLQWTLPAGFGAGPIEWPTPKPLPVGPLMNYGYEGRVLLPVRVDVPAGFAGSTLDVALRADWLVCREVCIPQSGEFKLQVPTQAATGLHAAAFGAAAETLPRTLQAVKATADVGSAGLVVRVTGLPAAWAGKPLRFFPETTGVLDPAGRIDATWNGGVWQATLPLAPQRLDSPTALPAVLSTEAPGAGVQLEVAVAGTWPTQQAPAAAAAGDAVVLAPEQASPGFALALLLALAGGLLLNLMPCVFPVLSLKVVGFASHAHDRRQALAGGLAYTAGVVGGFVALAALLLALRAGGEQLGWGFQLQSPGFVAALAALFTLIGLNLAGVFELGSLLPSAWATARARHPLADSALTGLLAVAVASPCTAPFMGASLGLALTLPAAQALLLFAALGLGMALPYLAATAWPAVARALPRPGAWMAHFRTLMAFPMFATVVWLVWVIGQQIGIDGAAALLGALVALAFAAWSLGSPSLQGRARRTFGAVSLLLLAVAMVWAAPSWRQPAEAATLPGAATAGDWQPWSPEAVRDALAQGRPVFVDFTAAWCVTCQVNKRTTLENAALKGDFEEKRVLRLRADWTRRDAAIGAELARLGRSGVPVYALYAPGAPAPRLLSEILSVNEVRGALDTLR